MVDSLWAITQRCAIIHQTVESLLDKPLALAVERRSGLVEDKDRRILEN